MLRLILHTMSFMYFLLFSIFVFDSLLDAFGNKTRIDYGTGDCFLMIWLPVMKLKIDKLHIVLANNYSSNAGFFFLGTFSHGVYHVIPCIFDTINLHLSHWGK